MVDAERLVSILQRITVRIERLRRFAATDRDDVLADEIKLAALKYTFQTAIEASIDAAHHVLAAEGLGRPATNAEAFRSLAKAGRLPEELAAPLADAVGFRNLLVHLYAEVDDERVVDHLGDLDVLDRFVDAMARLAG